MTDEQLKELREWAETVGNHLGLAVLALLDMVEELKLHIDLHVEQKAALNTDKEIFKARAMAAEEELRGHTQGGWISVETKSPKAGYGVMLCVDGRVQYGWLRSFVGPKAAKWHGVYGVITGNVTHWQPLPAAPPETKTAGELRGDEK